MKVMQAIKSVVKEVKKMFEVNRCRFAGGCKLYQEEGLVCNNIYARFPNEEGKSYCGRYRSMQEDEEMEEKIK